jgi:hypothetical protein
LPEKSSASSPSLLLQYSFAKMQDPGDTTGGQNYQENFGVNV